MIIVTRHVNDEWVDERGRPFEAVLKIPALQRMRLNNHYIHVSFFVGIALVLLQRLFEIRQIFPGEFLFFFKDSLR